MTTRVESAVKCFSEGFNCAQAVFSTYAPLFGVEEGCALQVSTGFGAGMGRLQEVCGAVTGAFMVIGCKHGMTSSSGTDEKEKAYTLIKEFEKRFCHLHGSISCRTLLGCDLNTEDGKAFFKENNLEKVKCTEYVRDASKIVEQIIL